MTPATRLHAGAHLPDHVVFRELPFCGVLLDTRQSRVYRLSQEAAALLREALHGPQASDARGLFAQLSGMGLVRLGPPTPRPPTPGPRRCGVRPPSPASAVTMRSKAG